MFIRVVKKQNSKSGKTFCQYQLCQSSRVGGKVKQYTILYLGSNPMLEDQGNRKMLTELMKARISGQSSIFDDYPQDIIKLSDEYYEKFKIKYKDVDIEDVMSIPPVESTAEMENVDLGSLEVEDARTFGGEHLCKQIMEKLQLGQYLNTLKFSQDQIDLSIMSIISRALFAASEHKTTQYLALSSSLKELFGYQDQPISHKQLYRITDLLYEHKQQIERYLYQRICDMFGLDDTYVIYDLSNTYFEGRKADSELAKYNMNSKEKRIDCKQVVFTGVINAEGFIRYSRIYEGNTADSTTIEEMITDLSLHSDTLSNKTVVMDAAFATEDNLAYIDEKQLKYVCVSRHRIHDYAPVRYQDCYHIKDRRGNAIDLKIFTPEGYTDNWMQVVSQQKRLKETSMADKLEQRFQEEIHGLSEGLSKKGTTKKLEKVWERIGRIKERHNKVSHRYEIEVEGKNDQAIAVSWKKKPKKLKEKDDFGLYFIRTNYDPENEKELWAAYNTIREVESTFRCLKSDLMIRPVYHQKDERIESHIFLAILAYQLVNTIRYMLKRPEKPINHDWKNIVRIMNTQKIQSVILNTQTKKIRIRKPSRPIKEVLDIFQATNTSSMMPAKKKYVVYH